MVVRKRFLVIGRVQGVGFRFFAEAQASVEGLHGFVRNLPTGQVEIEAEGDDESMGRFERALWRGPSGARVEDIASEALAPNHRATGFSIR
jgi:acylphosphatase